MSVSDTIMMAPSLLLLAAAARAGRPLSPLNNPCLGSTEWSSQPWCDPTRSIEERVADMVGRMNITEKIANLDTEAPAIPSLGLNAYNWWSEATHGLATSTARVAPLAPPILHSQLRQ